MILKRRQTLSQAFCDWCGIPVSAWYSQHKVILRILESHRDLHRQQGREGQSIRARVYP